MRRIESLFTGMGEAETTVFIFMIKPRTNQTKVIEETETPQEIGIRLANKRVPRIKPVFKGIGNLGGYKMESRHIEQIIETIDKWWEETKIRLRNGQEEEQEFYLK